MSRRAWSKSEIHALFELIEHGASFATAARALGRGPQAAKKKWTTMQLERMPSDWVRPVDVPPDRWIERDVRLNAPQRTLIGACVGDPPVGYSALDRRGAPSHRSRATVTLHDLSRDAVTGPPGAGGSDDDA